MKNEDIVRLKLEYDTEVNKEVKKWRIWSWTALLFAFYVATLIFIYNMYKG